MISGAESGLMPVGKHALAWMSGQVLPEPRALRIRIAAPANLIALRVQRDQMPGAEVVAVIALVRLAGTCAEVGVIASGARSPVLVVSGHREGDVAVRTPAVFVHRPEVG